MEKTNHKSDKMIKEYLQASMSTGGQGRRSFPMVH
jgi:hypothetical protein